MPLENKAPEPKWIGKSEYDLLGWRCPNRWAVSISGSNVNPGGYNISCRRFIKGEDGSWTQFTIGSEP